MPSISLHEQEGEAFDFFAVERKSAITGKPFGLLKFRIDGTTVDFFLNHNTFLAFCEAHNIPVEVQQ